MLVMHMKPSPWYLHPSTNPSTHLSIHSPIHPSIHSFTHPPPLHYTFFNPSCSHPPLPSLPHFRPPAKAMGKHGPFTLTLIPPSIHPSIHSFTHTPPLHSTFFNPSCSHTPLSSLLSSPTDSVHSRACGCKELLVGS